MNKKNLNIVIGGLTILLIGSYLISYKSPDIDLGVVDCKTDVTKKIHEKITTCPVPLNEKANFKGKEIARQVAPQKVQREIYQIEIVEIKPIAGGVEVLARAWNSQGQIGFGTDGTVDIERFRIFNPPVLVDDPNGSIIREWIEKTPEGVSVQKTRRLREDTQEAVLQVIEHNLSVMKNIHTGERIIRGKIGNTTSTFYPDANVESTSVDGDILTDPAVKVTWSTLITGLENDARTAANDSGVTARLFIRKLENDADPWNNLSRINALFDTSALPDGDTIDSATISFYGSSKTLVGGGLTPALTMAIVSSNPASNTALVKQDYLYTLYGSTDFATRLAYASIGISAYNNFALNASGLANISKTGISKFGVRVGSDVDNSEPTGTGDTYYNVYFSMADTAGTTQDPKLVVEHTLVVEVKKQDIIWFNEE